MTMHYDLHDYRILLNKAILQGDKERERAIFDAMAKDYEDIMKAEEIMDKMKMKE